MVAVSPPVGMMTFGTAGIFRGMVDDMIVCDM
jgi:hypothetical protein